MRRIVIFILALSALNSSAQDANIDQPAEMQTLLNSGGFGGMLSITNKVSSVNNQECLFVGAELAMVLGHSVNIGFAGYGLTTRVKSNNLDFENRQLFYDMGYGGFFIEPVIMSKRLVHITLPVVLGVGGVAESRNTVYEYNNDQADFDQWQSYYSDAFLVAEPGVNAELNVAKWMRVSTGVSYRFVSQLDLPNTDSNSFSGFSGNLSLRFGWF